MATVLFPRDRIQEFQTRLSEHPVYTALKGIDDLRVFMSHHVFSVWDFMSLCKYLQNELAPSRQPWAPRGHTSARRFINSIVIEEESDEAPPDAEGNPQFASHFELYCMAMEEIGAPTELPKRFVTRVGMEGIARPLESESLPPASKHFMETTFGFIATDKPHVVAAAFALGREHIIPAMFRSFLRDMAVTREDAPTFHFYLERHIHLDEDFHAPLSLLLLDEFIEDDPAKRDEAVEAAEQAVAARIQFWDGVLEAIRG